MESIIFAFFLSGLFSESRNIKSEPLWLKILWGILGTVLILAFLLGLATIVGSVAYSIYWAVSHIHFSVG